MIQEKLKGVLFDFEGYELRKVMHAIFFFSGYIRVRNESIVLHIDFFFKWTLNHSLRKTILEISFK